MSDAERRSAEGGRPRRPRNRSLALSVSPPARSRGRKSERPGVTARRDRLEPCERLGLREAQEQLSNVLAKILPGHELFPVRAVVDDRPVDRIDFDAILADASEDDLTIPRDLDVPRLDPLRPIQATRVHETPERLVDECILRHVGAEILQRQGAEPRLRPSGLLAERLDPRECAGVLLRLHAEHPQDLQAVLRRVAVEVVVEEPERRLGLARDLLDAWHPRFEFLLRVAVVVPRVRAMTV